ncbi:hypothetical protein D4764_15G0008750 [Takifugu flavidus]|uniref:Uncharacterized protein n=1 Tax=Takifugu flavidus TaxID=433684 RepID=A0A5C6P3Y5_9TELE|nr:hypothetical protein D4764_15G0008750 [Takifugu flavidus]
MKALLWVPGVSDVADPFVALSTDVLREVIPGGSFALKSDGSVGLSDDFEGTSPMRLLLLTLESFQEELFFSGQDVGGPTALQGLGKGRPCWSSKGVNPVILFTEYLIPDPKTWRGAPWDDRTPKSAGSRSQKTSEVKDLSSRVDGRPVFVPPRATISSDGKKALKQLREKP